MNRSIFLIASFFVSIVSNAQWSSTLSADQWVDSVFNTFSKDDKITQLFIVRTSAPSAPGSMSGIFYDREVELAIRKYRVGGICLFQGGPQQHAQRINRFQQFSKTPLLVTIDGEWGLGMRMDSVRSLPRPMMVGAVQDASIAYRYGKVIGEQCRRIGIQVNYGPVMDINNNPNNPVINDRSFGEDKYKVASLGIQYMKGLQDAGVMACAKHFPGHGDVDVDSHFDLPVINKSKAQLDSLELYPFKKAIDAGISSVMVAHLQVPIIDNTANRPTSISYNAITKLLRNEMGFKGLTFTDALEMQALKKYYPDGEASAQAVIAGNDMLCLPGDIPGSIKKIKEAIKRNKLTWEDIDIHVKRVLYVKHQYGLANWSPVNMFQLTKELNSSIDETTRLVAENALTLLRNDNPAYFPLVKGKRVAYIGVGISKDNAFARQLRMDYDAHVYYFDYKQSAAKASQLLQYLKEEYDVVVIGVHNYSRKSANNFGISVAAQNLVLQLQQQQQCLTFIFGNPYALKNYCQAKVLVACYEDDAITQTTAADILNGRLFAKGKLPVTVCESFQFGSGVVSKRILNAAPATDLGFNQEKLLVIDSIVNDAIKKQAIPGGVVLVAKDGKIAFEKAFGYFTYDSSEVVYPETIYDLASVTKIMATTVSVMKLYEEGKLDLQKTIGDYLKWVKGTNKADIKLWDIILHQAGLKAWIPFYKETVDTLLGNIPLYSYYSYRQDSLHRVRVAENIYLRNDWVDTMYSRILQSEVTPTGNYIYSDNDFIFLGKIVEAISGTTLDKYVKKEFYDKLDMMSTGFNPRDHFPLNYIAPTEEELGFRQQLLQGDVHDPGAAMFGGVAGHAGLFSNAYDLSVLAEVLLNGGGLNGYRFFKQETIDYFTAYHNDSRRGLGFDKPERDNATRKDPYPAFSASPKTFGHTGFTGTCIWMDPAKHLTFIMLSNRVHNNGDASRFLRMNVRVKLLEAIYQALEPVGYGH
ncbi:MAG: glycoside hydrolase family 3 N-terminal domain-containing protein [Chitinophagaceae bacterium]